MKFSRRHALKLMGAVSVSPAALYAKRSSAHIHLGAQTNAWPIDAKNFNSLLDVLTQIKRTGYEGFETGYFNLAPHLDRIAELRQALEATGLRFFGLHIAVGANKCDPETLLPFPSVYEPLAKAAKELGAQHWIVSSVAVKTPDQISGKAAGLRNAAQYGAQIGLPLLYHNHSWEFAAGGTEIKTLLAETESERVKFLLDAGHAFRAGADVPVFLKTNLRRIGGLHLRDYRDGRQVPLGSGSFPLVEVAKILKSSHWSGWLINEEDSDGKQKFGLDVIEPAFRALREGFPS